MRLGDLFAFALGALWQSKARTLLTLAGVALGGGMLVVSLSLGHGLRTLVESQFHKDDRLRTIAVYLSWQGRPVDEASIPSGEIEVPETVAPARRARVRQLLIDRYRQRQPQKPVRLTTERLAEIGSIEHVVTVVPEPYEQADVQGYASAGRIRLELVPASVVNLAERLVCGRLPDPDRSELLVSESALLGWGAVADADLERFVGRRLRLEIGADVRAAPFEVLNLLGGTSAGRTPTPDEVKVLRDVAERLPDVVAKLDLPPAERQVLQSLMVRSKGRRVPTRAAEEFTVVGVYYHDPTEERMGLRLGPDADLVLAARPGQEFLLRLPNYAENGFNRATVLVDGEAHVRGVVAEVERMGFRTYALVEWAERAMQEVTLIGLGMTVLSVLALVVAGLGITNTMVTSVLERTHDIGIMKAVGAWQRQIVGLFLIEGAGLGVLGGGLGLLGAWLFSLWAEGWIHRVMEQQWQQKLDYVIFRFPPWLLAGGPLFAVLVTIAAALLPARRAARIDPAVTLRTE